MQLEGKLAVITGAGRGIGRAMALAFAARGANLALLDVNTEDLARTRAQCEATGVRASTHRCNVARDDLFFPTLDAFVNEFVRLDLIFF
ncbi:MAG: hypothetical protein DIU71_18845, partial [Proteobacteria bacterium]